jgi:hypothetical protein
MPIDKAREYINSQTDINPDEILSGVDGLELKQNGELSKKSIDALNKAIEKYQAPSVDEGVVVELLVDYGGKTGKQKISKEDADFLLKRGLAKCIE